MRFQPLICMPPAWTSVFAQFAVHLFEGHVSIAQMEQLEAIGDRWNAENAGKRVELVVILPSDTRMTLEERSRMGRLIKHGESYRTASATVILAEGLLASMQRSVLTGMLMVVPPPHPMKVFSTVPDAVRWLWPQLGTLAARGVSQEELTRALAEHLAEFRARPDRPVPQRASERS